MILIVDTTDKKHIGLRIALPDVGSVLTLGDSEFIVIALTKNKIVCYNYILSVEELPEVNNG